MGRCEEFYNRWRTDPNWCEKSPSSVSQIDQYIKLLDRLKNDGVPEKFAIANFTEGAARPLLLLKNPEVKDKAIGRIEAELKKKEARIQKNGEERTKITYNDVKDIINEFTEPGKQHPTNVEEETYFVRFKIKDRFGEDMSAWVKIEYKDYEELVTRYGTV